MDIDFDKFDSERTVRYGIKPFELMIETFPLFEATKSDAEKRYDKIEAWLVDKIGRPLAYSERIAFAQGVIDYLKSEPATYDRQQAMDYLFEAKFLN